MQYGFRFLTINFKLKLLGMQTRDYESREYI